MHPGRREPDHGVAGLDARPADEPAPLGDSDREPGDVEVVGAVEVGHLGRLAAEQGTSGLAAAVGDALDELRDAFGVESPDRDAVEEQHRLGAAGHDVVDAHRDEVDAQIAQPTGLALQQRLRADRVGTGGEDRIGELRR